MKRIIALIIAIVMTLPLIAGCDQTPTQQPSGTDAPETNAPETNAPETDAPETEAPETESPIDETRDSATVYDRVVIIGIDGAGSFIRKANMPEFDKIFENGAINYRAKITAPIGHAESWGCILHGVTPEYHYINLSNIGELPYYHSSRYPSIFRVVREAYPDSAIASFATWSDFNMGMIEDNINVYKDTADTDAALSEKVVSYIQENDPKLLFVEFHDVAIAGETSDYGGLDYLATLETTDKYIADIYGALEEKGLTENTLFIVTTDHGGKGKYCNDATASVVTNCTFAAAGKTVNSEFTSKEMLALDTAAVVAYALAIKQPEGWTAMVPDQLFTGYTAGERPVGLERGDLSNDEIATDIDTADIYADDGTDTYERVIVIGVDGAGSFKNAETPYINKIFENGAVTYTMQTATPSISAQSWGSLFHGVTPALHGLTNSTAAGTPYDPDSPYSSFFRVVHEAYPDAKYASFSTWDTINEGIVDDDIGIHKDTAETDAELLEKILAYLDSNDPKIMYVQFDEVDGRGHSLGFNSEWQYDQLAITDGYIGQIYKKLDEKGLLKNTLIIVTADHGGTPDGLHGGDSETEMNIMCAVAGKTVVKGDNMTSLDENGNEQRPEIRDIPAIVAYALGVEACDAWSGTIPGGLFEGVDATVRTKEHIVFNVDHRDNASTTAPAGGITTAINAGRILAYQSLDKDSGAAAAGEIEYVDGFYGEAVKLDNGSVEIADFAPGTDSFSVAFWFKTPVTKFTDLESDPVVIGNKEWKGELQGFVMYLSYEFYNSTDYNDYYLSFNLGDGSNRMDEDFKMPSDWQDGWVYVVLAVDREAGTVGVSYDFGAYTTVAIPEELKTASFDGASGLILGQDSTKEYASLPGTIDDLVVVQGVLTADDIAALASYYGVK